MYLLDVVRRSLAANPHTVPVGPRESAKLAERGVTQPTLRTYFAWRRSLMLFVVCASFASAGLATYREATETEERVDLLETLSERFAEATEIELDAMADEPEGDEKSAGGDDAENWASDVSATEPNDEVAAQPQPQTAFGEFADKVQLAALYALPAAALIVVVFWTRLQFTFLILVTAFSFSFLVPLLIALCPWSWWGYVEPKYSPDTQPLEFFASKGEGLLEGAAYLVALLPTVLSLVPGVQRACIRVKLLLPQAMLPGFFLVAASPFYALFLLVVFVAVNQFDTHPMFFAGMLVFLAAPLVYVFRSELFTRPIASDDDYHRIRTVQRIVGLMLAVGAGLIVAYLATREALGVRLLGLHYKSSLLVPLDVVEFFLETLSRSMFITVLGADLFMRMNLAAWRNTQGFEGTPEAQAYGQILSELDGLTRSKSAAR